MNVNTVITEHHKPFVNLLERYGFQHIIDGENQSTSKLYRFHHAQLDFILHMTRAKTKLSIIIPKSYQQALTSQLVKFDYYANSNLKNFPKENHEITQSGLQLSFTSTDELSDILQNLKRILFVGMTLNHAEQGDDNENDVLTDVKAILSNQNIQDTEKEILIKARIKQSDYRKRLLAVWDGKCAVTGCAAEKFLIASHIKPWRECKKQAEQCLDENNGLMLIPNLDKAFDLGYISFDDDGKIMLADLCEATLKALNITADLKLRKPLNEKQKFYLKFHREQIFKANK